MDYARAVALALRLITKNGRQVSIQRLSGTASDATRPWKGAGVPTVAETVVTSAVFLPHASTVDLGVLKIDEELLKRAEQVAIVPGSANDLSTFHQFLDGGTVWRIEWARILKPASTTVLFVFGVKR